jgi:hypothetical protein
MIIQINIISNKNSSKNEDTNNPNYNYKEVMDLFEFYMNLTEETFIKKELILKGLLIEKSKTITNSEFDEITQNFASHFLKIINKEFLIELGTIINPEMVDQFIITVIRNRLYTEIIKLNLNVTSSGE